MNNSLRFLGILFSCTLCQSASAIAEVNLQRDVDCHGYAGENKRELTFKIRMSQEDLNKAADREATRHVLEGAKNVAIQYCLQRPDSIGGNQIPVPRAIEKVTITLSNETGAPNLVRGIYTVPNNSLEIPWNSIADAAENQAREQIRVTGENERKQKIAEAKLAARNQVLSQLGARGFSNQQMLRANPFPFVGTTVALRADFVQMISSSEGLFGDVVVTNLTSTQFTTPNRASIISIKVAGLKPIKTPIGGELNVPYGSFVAVYFCKENNCNELVD